VIVAFIVFAGELPLRASWLWQIPALMALQIALAYPLALALAVANVYVRDIESLVGIGFALLFFATPMVYPLAMVPERLRPWFEWNPLHALMQSWRSALLQGQAEAQYMAYVAALALVLGLGAWAFYRRFAPRIGELI
jgi:ABC-type polysaccharide/polyol phosphate export permease